MEKLICLIVLYHIGMLTLFVLMALLRGIIEWIESPEREWRKNWKAIQKAERKRKRQERRENKI